MIRQRVLNVVLVVVGLLFLAAVYPLTIMHDPALQMMLSVYATLGLFLLLASRDPSANRSLIAFTAWSSLVHAAVMAVQEFHGLVARVELVGVVLLVIIGAALIALAPPKPAGQQTHA